MVEPTRTFCRICEAACGLVGHYGPDGALVSLRPDREHPTSRGYACAKGTRFVQTAQHPDRWREPMVDGKAASWDEATATTAARLRAIVDEHGPHAVGIYFGNPLAFNALGITAVLGMGKALGTRNLFFAGSQDCNNKFAGARLVHGSEAIHPIPDFGHTRMAVVFGSNPYISQSSFVHLEGGGPRAFGGILERGGSIVWVDPRRSESANRWGEHLAIRPGTDAWLMLALLRLLADGRPPEDPERVEGLDQLLALARSVDLETASAHTQIPVTQIEQLAERMREAESLALHMSVGVNQGGLGTLCYVTMQALAYVTGNLDKEGGSLFSPWVNQLARFYSLAKLDERFTSRIGGFSSTVRTLPGGILADEILTPGPERIRAMLVVAGDPLRSIPGADRLDEAFSQLEFVAAIDMFDSRASRHAHVKLPAASWLERWDLSIPSIPFQRTRLMQIAGPMMPPMHDTRTDARIVSDIARKMKLGGLRFWVLSRESLDRRLPTPRYGFKGRKLAPGRYLASHRIRFWDGELEPSAEQIRRPPAAPEAFTLIGRRRRLGHNSWLHGGLRDGDAEPHAWLCPDDMQQLGLEDGDTIEILVHTSVLRIPVSASEGLARRTVVVPHGVHGFNVNALIPAGPDNIERVSGQLKMTGIEARIRMVPAVADVTPPVSVPA
ncbi:MAG: molybdopterin-dependent oxidoreductase [Deltaproteobacteria bacterium]|nr:molybdopterin-dependent oxidoreductase [Deltaproteobacteria bacterium]